MKSLRELYRIGVGPSSSHTMAPYAGCLQIKSKHGENAQYTVTLYGSLCDTGRGHGTDSVIKRALGENCEVVFDNTVTDLKHPNTMKVVVKEGGLSISYEIISLGGGAYSLDGNAPIGKECYTHKNFTEIKEYCVQKGIRLYEYAYECEHDIKEYLFTVWSQMKKSIKEGLDAEGILPGGLNIERKAKHLHSHLSVFEDPATTENMIVCAYAFAVAEQNASGGVIVTAPTCGASGVLPACLNYVQNKHGFTDEQIVNALATGGIVGNVIKHNASISGAECGCQAEIGSACSMASAALAELFDMDIEQIEYAAEVAMEHYLGLTCDPINGLVQIPCIERNAVAAMRAINALSLAKFLTHTRKISFDTIVHTMYETGRDMHHSYRETSKGGLAKTYKPLS